MDSCVAYVRSRFGSDAQESGYSSSDGVNGWCRVEDFDTAAALLCGHGSETVPRN